MTRLPWHCRQLTPCVYAQVSARLPPHRLLHRQTEDLLPFHPDYPWHRFAAGPEPLRLHSFHFVNPHCRYLVAEPPIHSGRTHFLSIVFPEFCQFDLHSTHLHYQWLAVHHLNHHHFPQTTCQFVDPVPLAHQHSRLHSDPSPPQYYCSLFR